MPPSFPIFLLPLLLLAGTLWLACAVLGVHGLLLGRMPGKWLRRLVRQPRLWGAGALLVAYSGFEHPSLVVVGIGLIALGHVVRPMP
jgi:VIT1/CCC1 family predicted Fe2+/Mn2+ transporter